MQGVYTPLEWPCYGCPRITAELRRQGWTVNPKRVYRLMREDDLLCVRRRKFLITTDSNQRHKVYPNLARELVLTGVNQLWIADLTYIRLAEEFVFLATILGAFSRRIIGWALDRTLDDELQRCCWPGRTRRGSIEQCGNGRRDTFVLACERSIRRSVTGRSFAWAGQQSETRTVR